MRFFCSISLPLKLFLFRRKVDAERRAGSSRQRRAARGRRLRRARPRRFLALERLPNVDLVALGAGLDQTLLDGELQQFVVLVHRELVPRAPVPTAESGSLSVMAVTSNNASKEI